MIKSIKYIALGLSCVALASCNDFLDQVADERTEITINSEADEDNVIMMLNTAYPEGNYAWIAELMSDNLMDNQTPHYPSNPNDKQVVAHYNYGASAKFDDELFRFEPAMTSNYTEWDSPGFIWSFFWSSIATCNYAINAMEDWQSRNDGKLSDKLRAALAEAKLIRAYDHFILANLFCQTYRDENASRLDIGLPYITQPESQLIVEYERGNVADLYKHIEEDLEAGLKDISEINMGNAVKYHFNTAAAHAFAARYYLFTRNYDKVIEHADQVLSTNPERTASMLLDYSKFDGCATLDDYAKVWQNPNSDNNLMLSCTASILMRKMFGYRYSYAGEKCQETLMIRNRSPFTGYICPAQSLVSGMLFSSSSTDYGFFSSKIGEEFEYADKIAGIGTPHIIQRTFTCANLLLERAEAKIMLGRYDEAAEDLMLYWNSSYDSFSEKDKMTHSNYFHAMTPENIASYYGQNVKKIQNEDGTTTDSLYTSNPNCFTSIEWADNAHTVSPSFNIPAEATTLLNCLNDLRRYENCYEGNRFFDIKRWGIPYVHKVGLQSEIFELGSLSEKRAIEVPWESLSAGLESSRGRETRDSRVSGLSMDRSKFFRPTEEK